jgi:hypothetical protein
MLLRSFVSVVFLAGVSCLGGWVVLVLPLLYHFGGANLSLVTVFAVTVTVGVVIVVIGVIAVAVGAVV